MLTAVQAMKVMAIAPIRAFGSLIFCIISARLGNLNTKCRKTSGTVIFISALIIRAAAISILPPYIIELKNLYVY